MPPAETQLATETSRHELARQQAALVDALKCGRPLPPGFPGAQICVAAKSLALKRASGIRKPMPSLVEALGNSIAVHLAEFTQTHPTPPPEGPRADAIAFARWLRDRESLPDSCLLQLEIAAVSWRLPMKIVRLPASKKSALIIRFPVFGVRVFTLLPGWQAKATRS